MITDLELRERADVLGLQPTAVEHDYVLNHLLAAIAVDPGRLVFRGGTALSRVWWLDFRLSEDLDFTISDDGASVGEILNRGLARARTTTGFTLSASEGVFRDDRMQQMVAWSSSWGTAGEVKIDAARWQRPKMETEVRQLDLPYSDLLEGEFAITALQVAEIIGRKWALVDEREEPRDLFDVWWALERAGVGFEEIARGHSAIHGYSPLRRTIERAPRLASRWAQRLGSQIKDLPDFDAVVREVSVRFERWAQERNA